MSQINTILFQAFLLSVNDLFLAMMMSRSTNLTFTMKIIIVWRTDWFNLTCTLSLNHFQNIKKLYTLFYFWEKEFNINSEQLFKTILMIKKTVMKCLMSIKNLKSRSKRFLKLWMRKKQLRELFNTFVKKPLSLNTQLNFRSDWT